MMLRRCSSTIQPTDERNASRRELLTAVIGLPLDLFALFAVMVLSSTEKASTIVRAVDGMDRQ